MTDSGSPAAQADAFHLLHPAIQRQLWDMQWETLRPLQADGIRAILTTRQHVILSAPTAAGKTEAAFLPILSAIAEEPEGSVRAVYVGPLKALINDQFARIGDLCTHLQMPVHSWHGDIAANKKAKLIADQGGILLITPESIESLFVNRPTHMRKVFSGLRFIVIDELHTFLDNERGFHLRSLLTRLLAKTAQPAAVRLIGLSATIGEMTVAQRCLAPDAPDTVLVVKDSAGGKELKLRVHCYVSEPMPELAEGAEEPPDEASESLADDLVRHCQGAANLVFANSRATVELLADACKERGKSQGLSDHFLVHHGSLSADIRRDAEATMKSGTTATTFCTPTLELGIDIGSVKMVGQVDPPWSVASLKQRLGRSGRRTGEPQILRMYVREDAAPANGDLFDALHLRLLCGLATVELMLEGWTEPAELGGCDLSTLTHQVVSVIGETGGRPAAELFQLLCRQGPFRGVDPALFARLLRQLGARQLIEQMPGDDLILGALGEKLYRHFTFYAVFQTPETFTLIHGSERLGTLDVAPEEGQHVLFAAKRWLVMNVDVERKEIHVKPARGRRAPQFSGRGGMLHSRIVAKMREVLLSDQVPTYLDQTGKGLLEQARKTAGEAGIATKAVLALGPKRSCILTWGGTRIHRTISAMMKTFDVHPTERTIGLELPMPAEGVAPFVGKLLGSTFNLEHLALAVQEELPRSKFDWLLGPELLAVRHARQYIDVPNALHVLEQVSSSGCGI